MEQPFDDTTLKVLEDAGEYFAVEAVGILTAAIRAQKLTNTRTLINSLSVEQKSDVGRVVHSLSFAFEEYGRHLDMKGKRWNAQPPVAKLMEWIEARGVASFGADPRPNKKKPKTEERRKNEIAWGIARGMMKRKGPAKARPWYNNNFFQALQALEEQLIVSMGDKTMESFKEALLWRLKRGGGARKYF